MGRGFDSHGAYKMTFPLKTERTIIRPLGLNDLDFFVAYRKDPEIARFQSWDTSYSLEQATDLANSQLGIEHPAKDQWLQLAICNQETNQLIGDLALHTLEDEGCFEIGFTISREWQGKGFAKEAATKLLDYLFEEVGAKQIIATTDSRNTPSIRLMEALGFRQKPEKTWDEEFKEEHVSVFFFELNRD